MNQNTVVSEITQLLMVDQQRFTNYQKIPEFIIHNNAELKQTTYTQNQLVLDSARYEWLLRQIQLHKSQVLEIGSNLGFFCLSLAHEFGCKITGYEPIEHYAKVSALLAELSMLKGHCNFVGQGLMLEDLSEISKVDLVIELNVLHHGGAVFDEKTAEDLGGWFPYAKAHLRALSKKAEFLFFQTGNMANGAPLFPSEESIPILQDLLEDSGWTVRKIGMIDQLDSNMEYLTYSPCQMDQIPRYQCRRNPSTNLVNYFKNGQLMTSLETGLANRPLWFCSST